MPPKKANRRVNHYRRILTKEPSGYAFLRPGMIIQFRYQKNEAFDRRPLVYYLWRDRKHKMIHGVNLNYLYESKVQRLFKYIDKRTPVTETKSKVHDQTHTRVHMSRSGADSAKALYSNVLKPKILGDDDAYRTYKIKYIKDIYVVEYDFDGAKGLPK